MRAWHAAQLGFARCCSICWRSVAALAVVGCVVEARPAPGGGGGGGAPRTFSSTHLPRFTGEVRVGLRGHRQDARLREHAAARAVGQLTRRNRSPATPGDAVVLRQPLVDEREAASRKSRTLRSSRTTCLEEQLRLAAACRSRRRSSKPGKRVGSGGTRREAPELQPLAGEVLDQRRARSGRASIRRTWAVERRRGRELAVGGQRRELARRACCSTGSRTAAWRARRSSSVRTRASRVVRRLGARRGRGSAARPAPPAAASWTPSSKPRRRPRRPRTSHTSRRSFVRARPAGGTPRASGSRTSRRARLERRCRRARGPRDPRCDSGGGGGASSGPSTSIQSTTRLRSRRFGVLRLRVVEVVAGTPRPLRAVPARSRTRSRRPAGPCRSPSTSNASTSGPPSASRTTFARLVARLLRRRPHAQAVLAVARQVRTSPVDVALEVKRPFRSSPSRPPCAGSSRWPRPSSRRVVEAPSRSATIACSAMLLGGRQVLLEQHRRQREHVADVVEAVAHVVGGEVAARG